MVPEDDDKNLNPEEEGNKPEENQPSGDFGSGDEDILGQDSGDDFGLEGEVPYDPIQRGAEETSDESESNPSSSQNSSDEEEEDLAEESSKPAFDPSAYEDKNRAPLIIAILVAVLLIGGGSYYFFSVRPAQQKEKERIAKIEKQKAKKAEQARLAKEREEQARLEAERLAQEEAEAEPEIGTVETISERTGRSYVVIGSFFDADFAQDFGNGLAQNGVSSKILTPADNKGFHRVAVEDFDTFTEAESRAAELRGGEFGEEIWAIKF